MTSSPTASASGPRCPEHYVGSAFRLHGRGEGLLDPAHQRRKRPETARRSYCDPWSEWCSSASALPRRQVTWALANPAGPEPTMTRSKSGGEDAWKSKKERTGIWPITLQTKQKAIPHYPCVSRGERGSGNSDQFAALLTSSVGFMSGGSFQVRFIVGPFLEADSSRWLRKNPVAGHYRPRVETHELELGLDDRPAGALRRMTARARPTPIPIPMPTRSAIQSWKLRSRPTNGWIISMSPPKAAWTGIATSSRSGRNSATGNTSPAKAIA
ncbi:hypothetical protein SAMN05444389_101259 [Paracoccus solventivorans]|uniref:Uncharacterized protein n=1 Tax=Paracoccus solventivorans TaxID=53463 RepID=A0A1M7DBM2_9RHOB|nr:hypothetical protein SAMN05444389_101259 [Paracoccus solventivorans]